MSDPARHRLFSMMPQQTRTQTRWSKVVTRLRAWDEAAVDRAAAEDVLVALCLGTERPSTTSAAAAAAAAVGVVKIRPLSLAA